MEHQSFQTSSMAAADHHRRCDELKQWIRSLTWPELQSAMEYTLYQASNNNNGSGGSANNGNNNNKNEDGEHELILEMMQLLAPKPSPIHPAALAGCKPFSTDQWTDGRMSEVERLRRKRRDEPRLFRLINRKDDETTTPESTTAFLLHDAPPEIQALLKQQQSTSTRRKRGSGAQSSSSFPQYQVEARSFFVNCDSPKGDRWSVPPTEDLRQADYTLLQRTVLQHAVDGGGSSDNRLLLYLRLQPAAAADDEEEEAKNTNKDHQTKVADEILNLLRIASRGKFLSRDPPKSSFFSGNNNNYHRFVTAPWFEHEQSSSSQHGGEFWFSLSVYLASQFEVALWKSFQRHQLQKQQKKASQLTQPNDTAAAAVWQDRLRRLPMPSTLHSSMCQALSTTLERDAALLPNTRGTRLFCLLEESICFGQTTSSSFLSSNNHYHQHNGKNDSTLEDLFSCPLLQLGTATEQIRSLARREVQKLLALEAEKELLQGLGLDEDEQPSSTTSLSSVPRETRTTPPSGSITARQRKRASKRKNNRKKKKSPVVNFKTTVSVATIPEVSPSASEPEEETTIITTNATLTSSPLIIPPQEEQQRRVSSSSSSSSSEEEEEENGNRAPNQNKSSALDFPPRNPQISQRVRNRNIVLALSILDDVVKEVFDQVGLPPDEPDGFDEPDEQAQQQQPTEEARSKAPGSQRPIQQDDSSQQPPVEDTAISTGGGVTRTGEPTIAEDEELTWPYYDDSNGGGFFSSAAAGVPQQQQPPLTAARYRGAFDPFSAPYNTLPGRFFVRPGDSIGFAWDGRDMSLDEESSWDHPIHAGAGGYAGGGGNGRDRSIMEEFFLAQERREQAQENIMASSTMASIASSVIESETEDGVEVEVLAGETVEQPDDCPEVSGMKDDSSAAAQAQEDLRETVHSPIPKTGLVEDKIKESSHTLKTANYIHEDETSQKYDSRSPSPQAPATPSPTLSPILVSLADLQEMRHQDSMATKSSPSDGAKAPSVRSFSSVPTSGMPNSPRYESPPSQMVTSRSRDNLRAAMSSDERESRKPITKASPTNMSDTEPAGKASAAVKHALKRKSRDDHDIKTNKGPLSRRPVDALESYRNAAARSLKSRDDQDIRQLKQTPPRSTSYRNVVINRMLSRGNSDTFRPSAHFQFDSTEGVTSRGDRCVRSEMGQDDNIHWQESRRSHGGEEQDNNTVTRDGSTTITSALSHRETDDTIREERDTYRDLCLTLGAEVAKLNNILAAQKGSIITSPALGYAHNMSRPAGRANYFDPESVAQFFYNTPRPQTLAAMSDAGFRGEHESVAASEDEHLKLPGSRHVSSTATAIGSDVSVEHSAHLNVMVGVPMTRDVHDPIHLSGVQSRLAGDIMHFVETTNGQLQKQDTKRNKAVERMTRLVNTVWPRAQVKLYGSHVTGLSLPSSDVDFVICLPAVHKNAPAVAPGALEGRNAINETSQKLLARKLKSESWIDPRSMKLIERTVVPVIKVATKDTKAKTLQLDITFDGPSHHGLEAVELVSSVLEELPMIRPLVLVLKQFLLDRGLLTGFTGGLSSYCLFLMTARYLQEQVSSWSDCGSLLMGFLDFYGNHFDPRLTGISVGSRQYFARPTYAVPQMQASPQPMWNRHHRHNLPTGAASVGEKSYTRRNSFSDKGSVDGIRGTTTGMTMGRFLATATTGQPQTGPHYPPNALHVEAPPTPNNNNNNMDQGSVENGMPYTFDPLFVEDPLSPGNNVGRNAFRIFQVQRAFSDAHRALVAALEWDMQSTGELEDGSEYPLLKCLLQTEDVVYDL